ncbi:hypothetical protein [Anaerospora hongkongensis]|uniref:hypothetical protein n=1 Tax=Anaerospora hongkongensis TaxID=244830 RepID=UPI00289BE130|nr:hypothetical protein [Anaerospora hongkongensis]
MKVLKRAKVSSEKTSCKMVWLTFGEKNSKYQVDFSMEDQDNLPGELTEILKTITENKNIGNGKNEDKTQIWSEYMEALKNAGFAVEELPPSDVHLNMGIDLNTGTVTGCFDCVDNAQNKVAIEILQSLRRSLPGAFSEMARKAVAEISSCIDKQDFEGAINLLTVHQEQATFLLANRDDLGAIFDVLQGVNPEKLAPASRRTLYDYLIAIGGKNGNFEPLYQYADAYIKEFQEDLDEDFLRELVLTKANSAAQVNKKELAYSLFKEVLSKTNDLTAAWAYRGMALILDENDPEAIKFEEAAADLFLQAGNRRQYTSSMVGIARRTLKSNHNNTLAIMDKVLSVYDETNTHDADAIARLRLTKATILNQIGEDKESYKEAAKSAEIRIKDNRVGDEVAAISSIRSAQVFGSNAGVVGLEDSYRSKIEELEKRMIVPEKTDYELRNKLMIALENKDTISLEGLKAQVDNHHDDEVKALYYMSLATLGTNYPLAQKLEYLERSKELLEKFPNTDLTRDVMNGAFALVYQGVGDAEKALFWYRKALDINPFNFYNRQNYTALLWQNGCWKEAANFFERMRKLFGDLPGILYGYGRSLYEAGNPEMALPYLKMALEKDSEAKFIREYIEKAIDASSFQHPTPKVVKYEDFTDRVTFAALEDCLTKFVSFIQRDKRMTFWRLDGKQHKWTPSPEAHAKDLLHTFLHAQFSDDVETLEEVSAGAGRIDLYLCFKTGLRTVIELKMCGQGYSENYAKEGLQQLSHYLENKNTHYGYLLIFDGRLRDYGKGFETVYHKGNTMVYCKTVDLRSSVK